MAKTKKKKGLADKVRHANKNKKAKGNLDKVRNNPFEIKVNKQKHTILGRKTKHDRGLPGVARSKANKKRNETLLQEWKHRHKSNSIKDERFGTGDNEVSVEEKMLERFALERKKKHEKMAQFNLNEEEELTHLGKSLSTLNQFDDFDPSDDEKGGMISSEYVENAHFGGGIFTKKTEEGEEGEGKKSRKEVIDEIIAKSKQAKYEKQANKDKDEELRDKLDSSWNDFEKLLRGNVRTTFDKETARDQCKPDEYDAFVRQMMFDRKAVPSQKSKSETELALEKEEEIRKKEEERQQRMRMNVTGSVATNITHQSADALTDDFAPKIEIPEVEPLSYLMEEEEEENKEESENFEEDESNEDEEEEESSLGDQGIEEDAGANEEEADSDDYSDIDSGNEDDLESFVESMSSIRSSPEKVVQVEDKHDKEIKKFPGSYSEFVVLLPNDENNSASNLTETLRKKFAPSAAKGNKAKMVELFAYVWQHCCEMAVAEPPQIKIIDSLTKHIFELCEMNIDSCSACVQQRLKISFHLFFTSNKIKPCWPTLDTIIQFKLIKALFSTSDFTHSVVTPALLFMCNVLSSCRVLSISDVAKGLFICTLVYEYVCYSRRFVPECLNFLVTTLCMAIPRSKQLKTVIPDISSRYLNKKTCDMLCCTSDIACNQFEKLDIFDLICNTESHTDKNKCLLVLTTIRLLKKFAVCYSDIDAYSEIFHPFKTLLSTITNTAQEKIVLSEIENVSTVINENSEKLRKPCSFGVEKPKVLRLFDPKIENVGEPFEKKSKKRNPEKRERERMLHKLKREKKGAIREIRKDSKFIARQKFKEQQEMDAERAGKVKRLYGLLSNQEGEVKNIQRKKYKLDI